MGTEEGGLTLFFDRCVGKSVPRALRQVGVEVEIHDEIYGVRLVSDEEWMGEATAAGHVLITRDRKIRSRPAERRMAISVKARVFVLAGNGTRLEMLRLLMIAWKNIELTSRAEVAPFIYNIGKDGRLTKVSLGV